jgi:hypothetical protein
VLDLCAARATLLATRHWRHLRGKATLVTVTDDPRHQPTNIIGTVIVAIAGRSHLRSGDLVGATLNIAVAGTPAAITIKSVEEDRHALGGPVLLHHFVVKDQAGQGGRPVHARCRRPQSRLSGAQSPPPAHEPQSKPARSSSRSLAFLRISLVKRKTGISLRQQATLPRAAKPFRDTLSVGFEVIASGE